MIVLFIIGRTKEPSTGYSMKKADFRVILIRHSRFYIVNPTGTQVHLLNEWQTGTRRHQVVHPAPQNGKAMSLDHHQEGPFDETNLDDDEIEVKETTWSLERLQDRCGTLDPVQARPDGRRAHACS